MSEEIMNGCVFDHKQRAIYYRLKVPKLFRINVMMAYVGRTIPICTTQHFSYVDGYEYILPDIDLAIAERILEQHVLFNNMTEESVAYKLFFETDITLNYEVSDIDSRDYNEITKYICPTPKDRCFKGYRQISLQGHLQNIKEIITCLKQY